MKNLRNSALSMAAVIAALAGAPNRVQAQGYQIDCAILLCLSGGWPASVPCARARAEFIRRITPWPIEPPLQIWRCPMGAAYTVDPENLSAARIYDILLELGDVPSQSFPNNDVFEMELIAEPAVQRFSGGTAARLPEDAMLHLVQGLDATNGIADIDISGAEFNFVRSIRVFEIRVNQRESGLDNDCNRWSSVRLGSYGIQGGYGWRRSSVGEIPEAHFGTERFGSNCPTVRNRSVFVDWRDYEGNYGFEQVDY